MTATTTVNRQEHQKYIHTLKGFIIKGRAKNGKYFKVDTLSQGRIELIKSELLKGFRDRKYSDIDYIYAINGKKIKFDDFFKAWDEIMEGLSSEDRLDFIDFANRYIKTVD